ncbi:GNAT family N-acetyltransferase [Escherichia coli]|uniref:GNAT family N-acetyltransferase n=1 Tax=Escherichia coli TaxID=562 RepID=UPI0015D62729|nr:GNAT family N-acetyltransferase [Escherichia coli]EJF6670436.1 GNAT family N-acetyltransferase [Escherichia coli]HAP0171059.1 GNAT family N-acetyltransferase [Escherichia coli]HAP0256078.1 GNAT family N-acetyltransferase [Escherichia coli]
MDIVNTSQQHLLIQLQKQMDDENRSNSPEGIGIMDLGSNVDCWHCVALEDGVPLGAATVQLGNELYKLYVAPQHRGRHVAEKLVSHVMDFLKEEGETEISIEMTKNSLSFWGRVVEKHSLEYEPIYGQLKMLIKLK